MRYNKTEYKKLIKAIKKFKNVEQLDILESCLDTAFHKITKESELKERGTTLIKLVQSCKLLKSIHIKISKTYYAIITIIASEELENGLGLVHEAFENDMQTIFTLYTLDKGIIGGR